ncbi:MAG: GxxExxY protein [Gemmatimonadaceae bacterium]|nr:GxxExxY protein [Gemmatimonadaceae bacterium]
MDQLDELSGEVIGAAIDLHRALGPGLLESVYEELLCAELAERRIAFERQVAIPLIYKGISIRKAFRVDLIVEGRLLVELKCSERPAAVNERQLLTYLRIMQLPLGLLINFGQYRLIDGVKRVANGYHPPTE